MTIPRPVDSPIWCAVAARINSSKGLSYDGEEARKLAVHALGLASLDMEILEALLHLKSRHQGQLFSYLSDLLTFDEGALRRWVKTHQVKRFGTKK